MIKHQRKKDLTKKQSFLYTFQRLNSVSRETCNCATLSAANAFVLRGRAVITQKEDIHAVVDVDPSTTCDFESIPNRF